MKCSFLVQCNPVLKAPYPQSYGYVILLDQYWYMALGSDDDHIYVYCHTHTHYSDSSYTMCTIITVAPL